MILSLKAIENLAVIPNSSSAITVRVVVDLPADHQFASAIKKEIM